MVEAAFFVLGVLPYWYTIALPVKSRRYWITLCWCCVVWCLYFAHHGAGAALVNNAVELCLALVGWARSRRPVPH